MYSDISPLHWNAESYPNINNFLKAWSLGNQDHITSQCGQSEFIYLISKVFSNKKRTTFTYLDVGANDGITASSTYFLAINGWMGICVEPHAEFSKTISARAKDSFCITAALGSTNGILDLQTSDDKKVLSTLEDTCEQYSSRLKSESTNTYHIPTAVIDSESLFNYYFKKFNHIDFYKVDCEGHELTALSYLSSLNNEQRPKFIEYENNYRKSDVSKLLLKNSYSPLVLFDSFAEIWYDNTVLKDHCTISEQSKGVLQKLIKNKHAAVK